MLWFLRKLLRRSKPQPQYYGGSLEAALRHSEELLACCGQMRRYHAYYRSGLLKCPGPPRKLDLRYNPLAIDEEFCPPWGELHFKCDRCGCSRGVHAFREDGKRGDCTDPDCPGCPGGLLFW